MLFYRFRLKYALEGSSNYISWKDRMEAVLEDNELKEFLSLQQLLLKILQSRENVFQTKIRIILERVWDHIVSSLHGKETPYAIWKALIDLFQNKNDHMKLALKEKLRKIKMEKGDKIPK